MAELAVLRLRDPTSFSYRGLRSPLGAALRGGTVNVGPLTCSVVTLEAAGCVVGLDAAEVVAGLLASGVDVDLESSTVEVGLVAARAAVGIVECD